MDRAGRGLREISYWNAPLSSTETCTREMASPAAIRVEELLRHLGQERAGQDVVDVAGAALDLLAAAGDVRDEVVAVAELGLVVLAASAGRSGRAGAG